MKTRNAFCIAAMFVAAIIISAASLSFGVSPKLSRPQLGGDAFVCPECNIRRLTEADLEGKTNQELDLMRNEIYARHGRPFNRADLRAYFMRQSWYRPDQAYTDSRLTRIEIYNVNFIKNYQDHLGSGGPAETKQAEQEQSESAGKLSLMADLDGDGVEEEITLKRFKKVEAGEQFHLAVYRNEDGRRKLIWEDTLNKYVFFIGDYGVEDLKMAGDVDGDGLVELVSEGARSDVSAAQIRLLKWQNNQFQKPRKGALIGNAARPTRFSWRAETEPTVWIDQLLRVESPGVVEVKVVSYSGTVYKEGVALVQATPNGYDLIKWVNPLRQVTP